MPDIGISAERRPVVLKPPLAEGTATVECNPYVVVVLLREMLRRGWRRALPVMRFVFGVEHPLASRHDIYPRLPRQWKIR